jgi:hypothetical protein
VSTPELVLEYINSLKWPVVATGIVLVFRQPVVVVLQRSQRVEAQAGPAKLEIDDDDSSSSKAVTAQTDNTVTVQPAPSGNGHK